MTNDETMTASDMPVRVLLAGPDTLYFSCDLPISEAMRDRLTEEKAIAQTLAEERRVHCPEWLGARVCPQGAKGGYAFLIETEDFSIKLLGERIQNRPSVYLEMRSYALHTHPEGPQGACRSALAWVRETLCGDQSAKLVNDAISFEVAKLSRADVHIDYQGGYAPSLSNVSAELRCFIRPGKTKGALYFLNRHRLDAGEAQLVLVEQHPARPLLGNVSDAAVLQTAYRTMVARSAGGQAQEPFIPRLKAGAFWLLFCKQDTACGQQRIPPRGLNPVASWAVLCE